VTHERQGAGDPDDTIARDTVLWRVTKPGRTMTCRVREIRAGQGWDDYVGLELRVAHNEQVFRTEVHKERVRFYQRVDELRRMLEAEGWTLTE
jgi:hypothetical protein